MIKFQRRQRTTFGRHQLEALQEAFKHTHYPEAQFRDQLARATNLEPSRIQVWFQNQRAKDRKRRGLVLSDSESPPPQQQHNKYARQEQNQHQEPQRKTMRYSSIESMIREHPSTSSEDMFEHRLEPIQSSSGWTDRVCIFSSVCANEAAKAVSEGKFDSILQYHRNKYSRYSLNSYYKNQATRGQFATNEPQNNQSNDFTALVDPTNGNKYKTTISNGFPRWLGYNGAPIGGEDDDCSDFGTDSF